MLTAYLNLVSKHPLSICVTLLAGLLLSTALMAQQAPSAASNIGTLAGKVIDKATAEEMLGVSIGIPGTTKGVGTDLNGKYLLKLEAGTYTVRATSVGYTPQEQQVIIKAGQTTVLNWVLEEASLATKEIEVVATVKKQSSEFLQIELRNMETVSSGLSAEVIRRTPDRTAADAVKRVSGASVQDNRFVIVRGLADRYNLGYLNGVPLPSSEADRKAFSLDLVPSSVLENIIITKTATPDMAGDFAGGLVQINTRDIPYERKIFINVGGQAHSLTTGQNFQSNPVTSGTDFLGFDGGARQLPSGALGQNYSFAGMTQREQGALLASQATMFNNKYSPIQSNARLNTSLQAGYADRFDLGNNQLGVLAFYNYNNSLRTTPGQFYDPTAFRNGNYGMMLDGDSMAFNQYRENIINAGILNLTFKLGQNHKFSWKNMLNQTADNNSFIRDRKRYENEAQDERWSKDYIYFFQSSRIFNSQFSAEHQLPGNVKLNYTLGYSNMLRQTPDFRRLFYDSIANKPSGDTSSWFYQPRQARIIPFQGGASYNPDFSGRFFSTLLEDNRVASVAVSRHVKELNTTFKVGGMTSGRGRSFVGRNYLYTLGNRNNPRVSSQLQRLGPDEIFADRNFSDTTFLQRESTQDNDSYAAAGLYSAGFAMADISLFQNTLQIIGGVRYESFRQTLKSATAGRPVEVDRTWVDWLPSVNVKANITDKLLGRFSFSQTVSRPEFREMAPLAFFEVNYNVIAVGNSLLERTRINNWDVKLEYYLDGGSMVGINPFLKYFSAPIETQIIRATAFPQLNYFNTKEATNYGLELEARLAMADFVGEDDFLRNFTLMGNYAYIASSVNLQVEGGGGVPLARRPLQGQSPYLINGVLQYQNEKIGLDVQLSYNRIGRRIIFTGQEFRAQVWERERDILDLSISQKLYKGLQARLVLGDILAQPLVWYQDLNTNGRLDDEDLRQFQFTQGRTTALSVNYTF